MPLPLTNTGGNDGSDLAQALESEEQREQRLARLDALGQALAKTRAEAIQGRAMSGIENDWHEDEEFYQGIDDANRSEHRSIWNTKPMGQAAPTTQAPTKSTVFPNITGPYCDAAAARIADMLLPTDDRNFAFKPTPVPELVDLADGKVTDEIQQAANEQGGGDPAQAQQHIEDAVDAAKALVQRAADTAEKAQKRIDDWFVECQYHSQVRLVIEDAARIGTGVLKGPMPKLKRGVAYVQGALKIEQKLKPASKRISVWDFFPDPACGENIQAGGYTWERDRLTRKQVRDLKKQPGYIKEALDAVMEEGPQVATGEYSPNDQFDRESSAKRHKFEVWYYHGTLERDDLLAAGCDCTDMEDPNLPALITMINNRVVRAALNPLDSGSYPYDVMVWRTRANHWTGIGVARQIRTPQRIVVAATRNLMDNAGLAAGPMVVIRQGVVTPADGVLSLGPRKFWYLSEDADEMIDPTKAFGVVKIDMVVNELMEIIQLGLKLAEDVTGMPLLLQGQQGKAPDTVGGIQILNNNASAVLRRLARLFDDRVTEPHVRRYYEWLLQYGEDDEKGDYQIDARGSSALVERDIQNQELAGIVKLSLDPRFDLDPIKTVEEYLRSRHFDPKRFKFDDEKWKQILAQMGQGGGEALAVAKLKSDSQERLAQFWAEMEEKSDQLRMQFEAEQNDRDRALTAWIEQMEKDSVTTVSINDIKAKLADTTIKTETQKMLSREGAAREALKPPTEPAGKATRGQSFVK